MPVFIMAKTFYLVMSADGLPFLACPRKGSKRMTQKRGFVNTDIVAICYYQHNKELHHRTRGVTKSRPSFETPPETVKQVFSSNVLLKLQT